MIFFSIKLIRFIEILFLLLSFIQKLMVLKTKTLDASVEIYFVA